MLSSKDFIKARRKFVLVSIAAALLLFTGGFSGDVFGQDSLRESVYGKSKNHVASPGKSGSTKNPPKPVKKKSNLRVRTFTNSSKKAEPKNILTVTFIGQEPMIEVWIDNKNVGVTDGNAEFSKKLAPGEYLLMAKNNKQVFLTTKKITITPEETSFKLFVEKQPEPEPKPEPVEEPKTEEKSQVEIALEISNEIKRILEDYASAEKTDSITTDDWQVVFQAAQLGQLQGYTAVQIEAQRWFASGQIELAKNEFANALTAFNKAQEFMPSSALPFYAMGNTYFANKQFSEALKCYQKALQADSKLAMAYKKLGDTQRLLGKEKDAISAYKNALQFGYQTPETRYWLGTLLLEDKQIEEALEELKKAALEMPRAEVFINIGVGYEKLKRDVSAIENYRKAIEVNKNSALAYYKLANVYFGLRELDKAKLAYEKAIELDPNGKLVDRKDAQKKLREVSSKLSK